MEIEVISFGKIAEFLPQQKISIVNISDTDELRVYLEKIFPDLAGTKYKLALNKNIVQVKTEINNNDVVAIMPPFSGG